MGDRGASSGMRSYQRNVRSSEDTIRNEPVEHLLLLDKNGKIALSAGDGKRGEVSVTKEMAKAAKDAVMTHNHPGGTTFSMEDIQTAFMLGLREIRATTAQNGTYSLKRNFELGDMIPRSYMNFASDYKTYCDRDVYRVLIKRVGRGEITPAQASQLDGEMRRDWLRKNAKNYGWSYKEER